ncbi:MAG: hypothetical protein K1X75_17785 [Leptospirales bacterium]|nr:hypothetical protein [Leptospirales bacterium]
MVAAEQAAPDAQLAAGQEGSFTPQISERLRSIPGAAAEDMKQMFSEQREAVQQEALESAELRWIAGVVVA